MDQPARRKTLTRKITTDHAQIHPVPFLFIVLVFLLILTPPVQNVLRKKAVTYLEKKLKTHGGNREGSMSVFQKTGDGRYLH